MRLAQKASRSLCSCKARSARIVTRQRAIEKKNLSQLRPSGGNDVALATGSHFQLLHGIWKTQISGDAHRL
jgi:hypothetical protein